MRGEARGRYEEGKRERGKKGRKEGEVKEGKGKKGPSRSLTIVLQHLQMVNDVDDIQRCSTMLVNALEKK